MTPTESRPQWQKLSARMLAIHPVQEVIRFLPALIGLLFAGGSSGHGPLWSLIGLGVTVGLGMLRWFTTSYRITAEQIQIRRGLLRRRTLSIPLDRVRTVDVTAHAMHRLLHLTRVTVGTGRSDRKKNDGLTLDALHRSEAALLRERLLNKRSTIRESTMDNGRRVEEELVHSEPGWIRYGPFTLSGFVTIGAIAALLSRIFGESQVSPRRFGPFRVVIDALERMPLPLAVIAVVAALLVLVAITSTAGYVLTFWNFRLTRPPDGTLHVTRGLLTSRATTLEERRLRGVEISEPLLLRWVGGARCLAIATGLRVGRGAERGGSVLLPPAPVAQADRVAAEVLRRRDPVTVPLIWHPLRARRRRFSRALTGAALVVLVLGLTSSFADVPEWVSQASFVLIPLSLAVAADRFASLGHAVVDGYLVGRWGTLVRRRWALSTDGIIGWNLRRSFFQRRAGLVTLTATTAGGRQAYRVQDVALAEALRVAEQSVPGLLRPFIQPPETLPAVVLNPGPACPSRAEAHS